MKRTFVLSIIGAAAMFLVNDIYAHTKYVVVENAAPEVVFVEQEPPTAIVEEVGVSPGPAYVWTNGYWKWDKSWKWVKGKWELKPSATAVWVNGYWENKHHHWVWKDGHWD